MAKSGDAYAHFKKLIPALESATLADRLARRRPPFGRLRRLAIVVIKRRLFVAGFIGIDGNNDFGVLLLPLTVVFALFLLFYQYLALKFSKLKHLDCPTFPLMVSTPFY
jgi:hypothetical protein